MGYSSVGAPHGESPGLLRESHIFHRKNSISCHGSCVQQEQVTLPGERAYGETVSPPKAPEMENGTRTHMYGKISLNPKGRGSPQGAGAMQAPCPVQARAGKQRELLGTLVTRGG